MASYPLLFGYRDLVVGNGYYAGVRADGRALLVDEDGGAWVYGVNPGGVAAGGHDQGAATAAFRAAYRSVLYDIASEAVDFADFKQQAEAFFNETNEPTAEEWEQAVIEVRSGKTNLDWLVQRPANSVRGVEVVEVEAKPDFNALDEADALAKAA